MPAITAPEPNKIVTMPPKLQLSIMLKPIPNIKKPAIHNAIDTIISLSNIRSSLSFKDFK